MSVKVVKASTGGGGGDGKVKVSSNDTTADYLSIKLLAGTGITLTENNDGGNETLTVSIDEADLDLEYARLDCTNQPFTGVVQSISGSFAALVASYTGGKAGAIAAGTVRASFLYDNTGSFSIQARTNAQVLAGSPSGFDTKLEVDSSGNVGIGTVIDALTAKFHLRSTGELFRYEYDASNYLSGTVSSAGRMSLTAIGSDNGLTLNPTLRLSTLTASTMTYADTNKDIQSASIGTGLSFSAGTLTNTAPDQTVSLTGGFGIDITGTYPSFTISTDSTDLNSVYARLDSTNQPFTSSGQDSLNTSTRIAYDSSELISINWGSRFLRDTFGWNSVNWESRTLTGLLNNLTLSWQSSETYDATVTKSLNWDSRDLFDSSASSVLNWESKILQRADGTDSVDWHNRILKIGATTILDWANASLNTVAGVLSVDADTRELKDSGGQTFLDWENYQMPWLAGTPGLIYADNSGYLDVRPNIGGFNCTVNVSTGYIQTGVALRFRAPYNFQSSEWYVSSISGGDVQLDILRSAVSWPVFTSDSICNAVYPELISGGNAASGSATTWDPIDKDDYIVILIYTTSTLEDFTLQVIGDKL